MIATSRCLELLHVDLMGPSRTESLGGKRYIMVIVDDFSRYILVEFLKNQKHVRNWKLFVRDYETRKEFLLSR